MKDSTSPSAFRSFVTAATGPRALAWPAMVSLFVTYVLLDLLTVGASGSAFIATVLAFAGQWGVMWLANVVVLKRSWPRRHPMLAVVVTFMVIVIIGGLASGLVGSPHDLATVLWRFTLTLIVATVFVLLSDYRADIARERAAQVALREARDIGAEAVTQQRQEVTGRLVQMLDTSLNVEKFTSTEGATRVRQLARERIRPLSHELISSLPPTVAARPAAPRSAPWRQVLDSVLATSLVPPLLTAFVVTFFFISRTIVMSSTTQSDGVSVSLNLVSLLWSWAGLLLVFAVTYLVARIVQRITNPLLPRLSLGRRVLLALGIPVVIAVAIEIAIEAAYALAAALGVDSDQLRGGFVERLFLGVPIVSVALFVVITRTVLALIATSRRQEQAMTADAAWEVARINETLHQERRFFAMQAHGPLQSAAAAAAARLDAATDEESLETVWAQASADLRDAIDVAIAAPGDGRDLPAAVASLAAAWEGICSITLECSPDAAEALGRDWVANASAVEIVTEAIGNATMHGSATHIYVSVSLAEADEVRIEVVNDGAPVDDGAEEGMGSRTLDEVTLGWKRWNTSEGVRFEARIPAVP